MELGRIGMMHYGTGRIGMLHYGTGEDRNAALWSWGG